MSTMRRASRPVLASAALLAGCAQMPTGPTVAVGPGPYKPFEVFVQDDELCRGWAAHSIGQPGHDDAARAFIASTAAGAALGAVAGAVIGGGRAVGGGAAVGAVAGAAVGSEQSAATGWNAQRRYDIAYQQCMYARGNYVPAYGYRLDAPSPIPPPVHP